MRLTIDLPPDVWHRLEDEAAAEGRKIGPHLRRLVIDRDTKRQARKEADQ